MIKKLNNFKQWDIIRKITLFFALTILLIIIIAIIINWIDTSNSIYAALNKIDSNTLNVLISNDVLLPKLLGRFWSETSTFTYLSNTFLGLIFLIFAFYPKKALLQKMTFVASVYITITLMVFWTLIFPSSLKSNGFQGLSFFASALVHLVNPIIGLILLGLNRKRIEITLNTIWVSFIPLFLFYFYCLIAFFIGTKNQDFLQQTLNTMDKSFYAPLNLEMYKFLNFQEPLFYTGNSVALKVVINIGIIVLFMGILTGISFFWKWVFRIKINSLKSKNKEKQAQVN
ncbi:MAGa3780 family membrane protein [Mycoplasmopsis meleagridis]|uniref:MAGa3780 family membrane protein n=1 Tax=Mycoplasmopsis meleagridis TaxID=29561 RepID=UPI003A88CD42